MSDEGETPEIPARGVMRRTAGNQLMRSNQSAAGMWFWEVDRVLMLLVLLLIAVGLVAVAAASPVSARRYSEGAHQIPQLYYFWRQLMWVTVSVPVMIAVSMLPVAFARRASLIGAGIFIVMLILVPFLGNPSLSSRPPGSCPSAHAMPSCRWR